MGKHDINAFLGAGTSFRGQLTFTGVVRVDGEFEGDIESQGELVVGREARVSGRLVLGMLRCDGLVVADVTAATRVVVHASGRIVGTVRSPSLVVEEGGRIDGQVDMADEADLMRVDVAPMTMLPAEDEQPSV
jgi:cytoskeletal protein CcmA (bactofilin family)